MLKHVNTYSYVPTVHRCTGIKLKLKAPNELRTFPLCAGKMCKKSEILLLQTDKILKCCNQDASMSTFG